jgi:hypothetical protein
MSMTSDHIHAFESSLGPNGQFNRKAARALLGCDMIANRAACSSLNQPAGLTWGELAKAALKGA